jgi:hypothetical protein
MELTAVLPRNALPPPSAKSLSELDLDPEHPETKALMARAEEIADIKERPTMQRCPRLCPTCPCCKGQGMVTPEEAEAYIEENGLGQNPPKESA